jgi:hypothetical protein
MTKQASEKNATDGLLAQGGPLNVKKNENPT